MPTVNSSFVNGVNECFEPFTAMIYIRQTQNGGFIVMNKHLQEMCQDIWSDQLANRIIQDNGSVQNIDEISPEIKTIFKTARELDQLWITKHAVARTPFISQSMSLNYYYTDAKLPLILRNLLYGWRHGLTTASYYTHFTPASNTHQFDECTVCST